MSQQGRPQKPGPTKGQGVEPAAPPADSAADIFEQVQRKLAALGLKARPETHARLLEELRERRHKEWHEQYGRKMQASTEATFDMARRVELTLSKLEAPFGEVGRAARPRGMTLVRRLRALVSGPTLPEALARLEGGVRREVARGRELADRLRSEARAARQGGARQGAESPERVRARLREAKARVDELEGLRQSYEAQREYEEKAVASWDERAVGAVLAGDDGLAQEALEQRRKHRQIGDGLGQLVRTLGAMLEAMREATRELERGLD